MVVDAVDGVVERYGVGEVDTDAGSKAIDQLDRTQRTESSTTVEAGKQRRLQPAVQPPSGDHAIDGVDVEPQIFEGTGAKGAGNRKRTAKIFRQVSNRDAFAIGADFGPHASFGDFVDPLEHIAERDFVGSENLGSAAGHHCLIGNH